MSEWVHDWVDGWMDGSKHTVVIGWAVSQDNSVGVTDWQVWWWMHQSSHHIIILSSHHIHHIIIPHHIISSPIYHIIISHHIIIISHHHIIISHHIIIISHHPYHCIHSLQVLEHCWSMKLVDVTVVAPAVSLEDITQHMRQLDHTYRERWRDGSFIIDIYREEVGITLVGYHPITASIIADRQTYRQRQTDRQVQCSTHHIWRSWGPATRRERVEHPRSSTGVARDLIRRRSRLAAPQRSWRFLPSWSWREMMMMMMEGNDGDDDDNRGGCYFTNQCYRWPTHLFFDRL